MLCVRTVLRPSPIHGLGLFLAEPVRAGQAIWRFDPRIDRSYTPSELDALPEPARSFLETYAVFNAARGLWMACGDDARFINHAAPANTASDEAAFGTDRAVRDLAVGEEITCDYRAICDAVAAGADAGIAPSASRA